MDNKNISRFFLGSNSRYGFHSLYDDFSHPERGDFLYIIKGGPGCGKSSFMKRIGAAAEVRGEAVEYIHCSGDPNSLDGVYLPSLRVGYVDGTAPHAQDAAYPAGSSMYLDLGRFYDVDALRQHNEEIMDINARYKALYSAAYAYISAASGMLPRYFPGLWGETEKAKMTKKLSAFAAREFKGGHSGSGMVSHRFVSAVSCAGQIFLQDTVDALCERVCLLDNELGMAHFYLEALAEQALESGMDVTVCHDCLDPKLISGLLIPEAGLALMAPEAGTEYSGEVYRHLRLDTIANREALAAHRSLLRRTKKLSREALKTAVDTLAHAKALHDELENVYNPHVDFNGVYSEAEKHAEMLFGK